MSERPSPGDWERWQGEWQRSEDAEPVARHAREQIARGRRELLVARLIESAVAGAAILITAAALRHAGNPFEAGLGLVVGSCIAALWIQRMRLREKEDTAVAAGSAQHLAVLGSVRRQEVRLAHFIWIVLPLELAFRVVAAAAPSRPSGAAGHRAVARTVPRPRCGHSNSQGRITCTVRRRRWSCSPSC